MPIDPGASAPKTQPASGRTARSAAAPSTDALRRAILTGELPSGVRLPPERELAERFGVNRVTIRAALAQLQAEHLLSVRQGSGYTVRDYRRSAGPDLIAALLDVAHRAQDRSAIVADLLLVRRQLARALFERLLEAQLDEKSLERTSAAVDRLAAIANRKGASAAELADADIQIVAELAFASGSTVLALCINPVASLLRTLPGLAEAMFREPKGNVEAWRLVLAWLGASSKNTSAVDALIEQLAQRDASTVETFSRRHR